MKTVLLFLILLAVCFANAADNPVVKDTSPHGLYAVFKERKTKKDGSTDDGYNIFLISKDQKQTGKLICETWRDLVVKWSPDDHWFAIVDMASGHSTTLSVFQIVDTPVGLKVETIYKSPDFCINYINTVHWDILSWDIDNGTIKIQCKFADDRDKDFTVKTYDVPIGPTWRISK